MLIIWLPTPRRATSWKALAVCANCVGAGVNAVCAGTTLAGFGGMVFSGYRGLRGLGLACLGGVALALALTQWLLPRLLEKWPLEKK